MDMRKHFEIAPDLKVNKIKPTHGNCCTCQTCGHSHDECFCWENKRVEACEAYEQLQAEREGLKRAMKIHAGDICSANNEAEQFIDKNQELEKEVEQLQAELKETKPFMIAVKKRHNGYNPAIVKELGIAPPESPEKALQDLQDEWDSTEDIYADELVKVHAENEKLETQVTNQRFEIIALKDK